MLSCCISLPIDLGALRSASFRGETANVATVVRNWWAYPAAGTEASLKRRPESVLQCLPGAQVGFGASLELPVQKFEVLDTEKTELGPAFSRAERTPS